MQTAAKADKPAADSAATAKPKFLSEPLVKDIYTADPLVHVFNGKPSSSLSIFYHDTSSAAKPGSAT